MVAPQRRLEDNAQRPAQLVDPCREAALEAAACALRRKCGIIRALLEPFQGVDLLNALSMNSGRDLGIFLTDENP